MAPHIDLLEWLANGRDIEHVNGRNGHKVCELEQVAPEVTRPRRGWLWLQRDQVEARAPKPDRGPRAPRTRRIRQPGDGSRLIACALFLLFILAGGLLGVSYAAQYQVIELERHGQILASNVEALASDAALMIFSLLALGLARKGLNALVARWGVILLAALSAAMNYAAASGGEWRSVLTYCGPSVLLAFVVDTTVSVIKKHYLGMQDEASPFALLTGIIGRAVRVVAFFLLWVLRLVLAPVETPMGLRRMVLLATPLPEPEPEPVKVITAKAPKAIGGGRGPRANSKTSRFLDLVITERGPLAEFPLDQVSRTAGELAPRIPIDPGNARTVLRKAVLASQAEDKELEAPKGNGQPEAAGQDGEQQ